MKILLYAEEERALAKSGIGRAIEHQKSALTKAGIEFTTDKRCTDYDILHINTYEPTVFLMMQRARRLGKKIVLHAHSTEEDFRNSFIGSNQIAPLYRWYLVSLYSKADYLITPTPYSQQLLESYGVEVPIRAISNGVDLERFKKNEEKERAFREAFDLKEQDKVIICVGMFFERKGISDFIEVAEQLPDYKFIWFGDTPLYTIPKHVRQIVQGAHPANVTFPGYIKGDILEGAYSAADVFFFPSYEETEGIVTLEALASQQNVLVRNIPIYNGWLEDGINCYTGDNNADFVTKIRQIAEAKLPKTGSAALKTAQMRSIANVGQKLKEVYEEVLELDYIKPIKIGKKRSTPKEIK